jgi:hypothetical protein
MYILHNPLEIIINLSHQSTGYQRIGMTMLNVKLDDLFVEGEIIADTYLHEKDLILDVLYTCISGNNIIL